MWTPARRRRLIVTAVLIIAVPCQAEAVEYYNLSAISTDEIRGQLGRIKEADPGRRKLGADGVAPGPLRNQSSNGADLHLLGSDRMDPVALPAQTIEKPKAPQDRIHQLTAQQEQPPDAETDRARKEAERLRLQLSHTTEELKAYRDRVHQLEAQLKQAPGAVETIEPANRMKGCACSWPTRQRSCKPTGSSSPARGTAETGAGRSRAGQGAQTGRRIALAVGACRLTISPATK